MLGVGTEGPVADTAPWASDRGGPADVLADRDAWAVLASVAGLGPVGLGTLLARFGGPAAVCREAAAPGGVERIAAATNDERRPRQHHAPIGPVLARAIADAVDGAPAIVVRIRALGLEVVSLDDPRYPASLGGVAFPPHVLFIAGSVEAVRRTPAVAVVGTRGATGYGRMTAARIARALVAADMTVVSGLALGIDGVAHDATVRAGGTTVAVIAGGHAHGGPPSHRRLAEAIVAAGGAIVSELAPDLAPSSGSFPRRNRIISGLSAATVVVEAPARSGALITASWAMEQGRACFVVPGPLDAPASEGCLSLLREFPTVVRVVAGMPQLIADIRHDARLGPAPAGATRPVADPAAVAEAALAGLGRIERAVLDGLLGGHRTIDELVAVVDAPVATVLAAVAMLERRGLAAGVHGRYRPAGVLLDR